MSDALRGVSFGIRLVYPILFYIGKLPISPYGVLLAVALLLGVMLGVSRARRVGVSDEVVLDVIFYGTLVGFLGGRIAFILTHLHDFFQRPMALILDRAGFTFMGGLVCALLLSVWIIRRRRERFFNVVDVLAPPLALGHALGRLGCLCAGCCYGVVCPAGFEKFGVSFPLRIDKFGNQIIPPALYDQVQNGLLPQSATRSLPVWPSQPIESAGLFLIFFLLLWVWRRRRYEGQVFTVYLLAYGIVRFGVEFLRGDADRGIFFDFSTSQWLSIACVALAIVLWRRLSKGRASMISAAGPTSLTSPKSPRPRKK